MSELVSCERGCIGLHLDVQVANRCKTVSTCTELYLGM